MASVLTPEFVSYRMDCETRKRSPYATINKVTQGFIRVGASEAIRPVVRSSHEVFDTVYADAVYRQDPAWASALRGVPGRSEGWRVRDLIEVLVGCVNIYYREKESAEFEVDTLGARFSMIGEYERGLKRYRRSDDDVGGRSENSASIEGFVNGRGTYINRLTRGRRDVVGTWFDRKVVAWVYKSRIYTLVKLAGAIRGAHISKSPG